MHALHRLAAAALVVALVPRPALADGPPLSLVQVYCQPGSLNNCFAFAIQSSDGGITYWLQNLQGSIEPGGTAFGIQSIRIADGNASGYFLDANHALVEYQARQGPEGHVRLGTSGFGFPTDGGSVFNRTYSVSPPGPGFVGCINPVFPPGNLAGIIAQTCLPTGLDGFMRFDAAATFSQIVRIDDPRVPPPFQQEILIHRPADQEDFYFEVAGCGVYAGSRSGFSPSAATNCSTDISYADLRARFTTVPEPSSIALVGSGLLGTGLVGRRRRKS